MIYRPKKSLNCPHLLPNLRGHHTVFMTWPTEGRMDRMSETSFTLHGEKLVQISSPAFMLRRFTTQYTRVKVFMRKVMRQYCSM